ncbi:ATP-binding cassette domain-containing protein [Terrilactibacillus sp. BCM23-1]|uniref:ATP-binding cassette domain-containing protein n=1 Tax=Terrilactibacillus tamarindi TaxID=2599694 RepID=A0A6N8CPM8_9BACI|nr:ABC transporter ATP-binding protein [Terrilactibacillus tamarindi]MTT31961.1 ATP-binding cassette domain-containing protein [Terrilactibacillus tamarindi]
MNQPAVKLEHVTKQIGRKTIIKDLTFDIYSGEVFGFLGPNGAGKTTTIRMIVGLMKISQGNIFIHGKSIKTEFKQAIKHIGAIVENPEMYKYLSGYNNLVHYARMINGVSKERIDEVVKLVGLSDRIHDKVKRYSLGMRQRLGLAQALLHSPDVLILDEPTNGLDPAGIREMRQHIRKLAQEEGIAVIVSSHLLSEMELMCDRIGIIQKGKLIGVQTVNEFIHSDTNQQVQFYVDKPKKSSQVIIDSLSLSNVIQGDTYIELSIIKEQIPLVCEALIKADIKLYNIKTLEKTLEEKFLEVTGGVSVG